MMWFVGWAVISVICAVLGGYLANSKNRDYSSWAAWCFIFWPMVIALLMTPAYKGSQPRQKSLDELDREPF